MKKSRISPDNHRLVFVIEALTIGGAEQMLVAMANRLVERGWTVHLICLSRAGELAQNLDNRVVFSVLGKRPGFDWRLPWRLRQAITRIDPVAINSHLWTANLWTRLAFPLTRRRIVVTEHSRDSWKPVYYHAIDRLLSKWTHRLVAVSSDTAAFYTDVVGVTPERVTVINNGIDTARFSAGNGRELYAEWAPDNELLIGTVGRLVDAKNHLRLIEAADKLRHRLGPFKVVIVGSGENHARLQAAIDARGLGGHVRLVSARTDIPDILSAFDLFVLSSDREGHPLTALEAQAAGTPVVLTDAGGSRDALAIEGDQTGGLLVEKSASALADAIQSLAGNRRKRDVMASVAKRVARRAFDLDKMVDRYADTFFPAGRTKTE